MFINEVISYKGAWENLNNEIFRLIEIEELQYPLITNTIEKYQSKSDNSRSVVILHHLANTLKRSICNHGGSKINYHSVRRDNLFITTMTMVTTNNILKWLYDIALPNISSFQHVDIAVLFTYSSTRKTLLKTSNNLDYSSELFKKMMPLSLDFPFLIVDLGLIEQDINIHRITSSDYEESIEQVERCITFPPEYYQAGLSILNYFGTVLRNKYPEQKATVKIEQHENMVRMIVESENGDKEIIEKALYEYELVMSGQTSVEDFYQDPIQTLELRNQIRMMQFQVE